MPNAHEVPCTSIVPAAHEPAAAQPVVINPVKSVLRAALRNLLMAGIIEADFDVPFVLPPSLRFPPVSGSPPGPRRRHNISASAAKTNTERASLARLHAGQKFRAKHPESDRRAAARPRFTFPAAAGFFRWNKWKHAKFSGTMRIHQLGRTYIGISNQPGNPRDRHFQFFP